MSISYVKADKKKGAVMVVGAGVAGMQASLDLASSGYYVHLVDKSPTIGGIMSQLDKTFPTNDCAMCIISPKLVEVGRHININIICNSDVLSLEGEAGNFKGNPLLPAPTRRSCSVYCLRPVSFGLSRHGRKRIQSKTRSKGSDLHALPTGHTQGLRHRP